MIDKSGINNPNYKHGKRDTRTYDIWAGIKKRCNNPKTAGYKNYGGRGITYDSRWETFENFLIDMGECPDGLTLERINVNADYCKDNCRWATVAEQARNHTKRKDNKSGYTGVWRNEKYNARVDKFYPCWVATWVDERGKSKSRSFSIKKYGDLEAENMAKAYRMEMLEVLKGLGFIYADSHGL